MAMRRVFCDDHDTKKRQGGDAYANFGINPAGVVVIVRPDGYVGTVAPFEELRDVNIYLATFARQLSVA